MVCSHCKLHGHNYRTCPTITKEELEERIERSKQESEMRRLRREARLQRQQREQEKRTLEKIQSYEIINPGEYELVLYWGSVDRRYLQRFAYIGSHSTQNFDARKLCRIVAIPFLEVCHDSPDAIGRIELDQNKNYNYVSLWDKYLKDIDSTTIVIEEQYTPPKSELDKWKECALKSKYLLDQIIMLGGKKYDNLEPILDMVQDIIVPQTTEIDKEIAGIPSTLTNVT